MTLRIRHFIAKDGERFSQLYDLSENVFPAFYPTAYCSRVLRGGFAHGTQREYLQAIKKLYEWAKEYKQSNLKGGIDLHQRLITRKFFAPYEIDSLASYISLKKNSRDGETIVGSKINCILVEIARYLSWYAEEVITDSNRPEVNTAITKMIQMINARKVKEKSKARSAQKILTKKLTNDARAELQWLFDNPLDGVKNETNMGARIRNVTALRTLYDTGMRIGELLSLRLGDFKHATGGDPAILEVSRYHDDIYDDRKYQPVAKTLEHPVPIAEELAEFIIDYLKNWRSKVPNVGFNDNDFLFVTHRKGNRQGKPLTLTSFRSAIDTLKKQYPELVDLHPHLLRHDWNYRFSETAVDMGYTEMEESSTREFLMGWVDGSQSAALYNRRHIQEQAFKVGLLVASHTALRRPQDD